MKRIGGDRQVRFRTIAGLVLILGGGVVIFLGWWGMAGRDCSQCQLPYIVSGGLGGLAMVVTGSALLVMSGLRAERIKAEARTQELIQVMGRLGTALTVGEGSTDGLVLAGKSTYHRPECRLVKDKDLEKVSLQVASASGLAPCRVCSPETLDEPANGGKTASEAGETSAPAKASSSRRRSRKP